VSKLAVFLAKFKFFSLFLFLGVSRYFGQFLGSQVAARLGPVLACLVCLGALGLYLLSRRGFGLLRRLVIS
jgi:hypothetical protein